MRKKTPDFIPEYQKEFQEAYRKENVAPISKLLIPYNTPLTEIVFTLEAKINEIIDRLENG